MGVGGVLAGFAWADAFAVIVVAGILLVVAYRVGREGAEELIDSAASPDSKRIYAKNDPIHRRRVGFTCTKNSSDG